MSTKLSSVVFQWFTLNLSSILLIKMKLKKKINYRKRSQYQTTFIYKNIYSKSCRAAEEFWRFSIERRAGRGSIAGGCCGGVF